MDNDGVVGILDFLQVLSSWGPCPAAVLIAVATTTATAGCADGDAAITVRQWSDGFAEYRVEDNDCGSTQSGWAPMPPSLTPPMSLIVALDAGGDLFSTGACDSGTKIGGAFFVRLYADGTTETIKALRPPR